MALRGDAGVALAFGAQRVKVYDLPPVNAAEPYVVIGEDAVDPLVAEGFGGVQVLTSLHVWSRTTPPGFAECKAIAAAALDAVAAIDAVDGWRLDFDPTAGGQRFLPDADGLTAHGVLTVGWTASPA
ncbi:MAG: DUF3168 domain-containing protein [Caulobacteraceae bacterium]